mgnify:CR=1 FL=1
MKFYRVTTPHNQDEINEIIRSMTTAEVDQITSLYGKISMVEYTDEKGNNIYNGGDYTLDNNFLNGPKEFSEFAKKMWDKNLE